MKKLLNYILLILLPAAEVFSIQYPVTPTEPRVKNVEEGGYHGNTPATEKEKQKQKKNKLNAGVKITLWTGDFLYGRIHIPPEVTFKHYRKGLEFTKTVKTSEIKSIEIKSFSEIGPQKGSREKKSENLFLRFEPAVVRLQMRNGRSYTLNGLFSFLRRVPISTIDGRTVLYSFFGDTWQKEKGWSEVASRARDYHMHTGHPQGIRVIEFTDGIEKGD